MVWSIEPNKGLGRLRFGMVPEDVADVSHMGRAGHVYRGSGGRMMEYRGLGHPVCEYESGRLTRIVAGHHMQGVVFEGMEVFSLDPPVLLRRLESRLGPVTLCNEQLYFMGAGLCFGGFYDPLDRCFFAPQRDYHDERCVTLFAPGESDEVHQAQEELSFL